MNGKRILFMGLLFSVVNVVHAKDTIALFNETGTSLWAAVYCVPTVTLLDSSCEREHNPVEIGAGATEPVSRPSKSVTCRRYLVVSESADKLPKKMKKTAFDKMSSTGVGMTTFNRQFDFYYAIQKKGKYALYNPFSYLTSGKVKSLSDFATARAAEIVRKDSLLIKNDPYKDMVATVRVGQALCPDETEYVRKRKEHVKNALQQLTGKTLNGSYIPTIAFVCSGGGTRAMTCMAGFHVGAAQKKNGGQYSLLDAVLYDVGLSGGAWYVGCWTQSKKSAQQFSDELRETVQLGSVREIEKGSKKLSESERDMFAKGILVRAALEQPVTLVNFWGSLLATRYLRPYGDRRQSVLFSQSLSADRATSSPFPVLTAVNGYDYDNTAEFQAKSRWFEFTPYEVGGVGSWLGNAFVPTWGFGRKYTNQKSTNKMPEYDLGLLMGTWGSAFAVTFARAYAEILPKSEDMSSFTQLLHNTIASSKKLVKKAKEKRISEARVHNFAHDIPGADKTMRGEELAQKHKLLMIDAGLAFNLPYPPVSGHGARKADIIILLDASGGMEQEKAGPSALHGVQRYAHNFNLPFPNMTIDASLIRKAISIFKPEDSALDTPIVAYMPRTVDENNINYDSLIPAGFSTNFDTLKLLYSEKEFNQLSGVTRANMEQSTQQIIDAITWDIQRHGGFAAT